MRSRLTRNTYAELPPVAAGNPILNDYCQLEGGDEESVPQTLAAAEIDCVEAMRTYDEERGVTIPNVVTKIAEKIKNCSVKVRFEREELVTSLPGACKELSVILDNKLEMFCILLSMEIGYHGMDKRSAMLAVVEKLNDGGEVNISMDGTAVLGLYVMSVGRNAVTTAAAPMEMWEMAQRSFVDTVIRIENKSRAASWIRNRLVRGETVNTIPATVITLFIMTASLCSMANHCHEEHTYKGAEVVLKSAIAVQITALLASLWLGDHKLLARKWPWVTSKFVSVTMLYLISFAFGVGGSSAPDGFKVSAMMALGGSALDAMFGASLTVLLDSTYRIVRGKVPSRFIMLHCAGLTLSQMRLCARIERNEAAAALIIIDGMDEQTSVHAYSAVLRNCKTYPIVALRKGKNNYCNAKGHIHRNYASISKLWESGATWNKVLVTVLLTMSERVVSAGLMSNIWPLISIAIVAQLGLSITESVDGLWSENRTAKDKSPVIVSNILIIGSFIIGRGPWWLKNYIGLAELLSALLWWQIKNSLILIVRYKMNYGTLNDESCRMMVNPTYVLNSNDTKSIKCTSADRTQLAPAGPGDAAEARVGKYPNMAHTDSCEVEVTSNWLACGSRTGDIERGEFWLAQPEERFTR